MSNGRGEKRLIERLQPGKDDIWSIIRDLVKLPENERRRLLRPHAEMLFSNDKAGIIDKESRRKLDVGLGALTFLEIAYELDLVDETVAIPERENLKTLFQSEAFLRYANAYLYFGIRFLSWRILAPEWTRESPKDLFRDSNRQSLGLIIPPELKDYAIADEMFVRQVDSSERCDPAINLIAPQPQVHALTFLDGFTQTDTSDLESAPGGAEQFELWLRGLSEESRDNERFQTISTGLRDWAFARSEFYLDLQTAAGDPSRPLSPQGRTRPVGGWVVTNPLAARFALADVYWISRLLRAEVTADATVTYTRGNWLRLLRFRSALDGGTVEDRRAFEKAEEVLRSVFDFVCDLTKNAVEITNEKERQAYEPDLSCLPPPTTAKWRKVFDEELDEIERQRERREFKEEVAQGGEPADAAGPPPNDANTNLDDWMERIRRNKPTRNLIGLSFSGGGIRSATFNLGVLQGLQELDLLRKIDFISTVSGGGFIGSWLVANVYRTKHWLGRLMNWDESISHLRRYSNYLAPRLGVFTTDTWSMWVSWARNAFLIQITGLVWLWTALLIALLGEFAFIESKEESAWYGGLRQFLSQHCPSVFAFFSSLLDFGRHHLHREDKVIEVIAASALMCLVLGILLYNLSGDRAVKDRPSEAKGGILRKRSRPSSASIIWWFAIIPSWCASFLLASILWADAKSKTVGIEFQRIRDLHPSKAWHELLYAWPALIWAALFLVAFFTLSRLRHKHIFQLDGAERIGWRIWHAAWIGLFCVAVLLLQLWGILSLFTRWTKEGGDFAWCAYILGPPLVLAAHTTSVVLFIGFCGKHSKEAIREWWTRFGAGLAMFGAAYLALTITAVFGPDWMLFLLGRGIAKWSSILAWLGTVIAGLLAGKSSKTGGNGLHQKSPWLQMVAKIGGFAFIVGAILLASTTLYILLSTIGAPAWNWHEYWKTLPHIGAKTIIVTLAVTVLCGALFSRFFEINIFGLNQFYRFRLVRCYLGATRWAPGFRKPQPFTNFDGEDDIKLGDLFEEGFRGPFPIYNCALNLSGSADLALHTRHSASFSLTPLRCGSDRPRVGYAPTAKFADGVMLGQAVAISGAAASPNMGFNTSPLVAFLLTMFNVRLGWWFPNPGKRLWHRPGLSFSLYYLVLELFGVADEKSKFVNVSDGGHFENLGVYELVRRRCKVIVVCDAECDEQLQFGSLGNLVRMCETDFGAKIEIDVRSVRQQKDGFSSTHCSIGQITYCNGSLGYMIYLKASMSGDEDVGIAQYHSVHPSFPHETTADQFFSEDQFESYRRLGQHIVRHSLRGCQEGDHPVAIAEKLADVLAPSGCSSAAFLKHTKALDRIWERFRSNPNLHPFFDELLRQTVAPPQAPAPLLQEETLIGLELIQLMENVFLDLRLDDFWAHPDNRGWAILFMRWARSRRFREIWNRMRRTYGIRFEYFCEARLGLRRDDPIVRV